MKRSTGRISPAGSVAPHVGAWIETPAYTRFGEYYESLPMWERGLKHPLGQLVILPTRVAPHVGAWIETYKGISFTIQGSVAPHVGAWIETEMTEQEFDNIKVAPHVGAWIETYAQFYKNGITGRSPCGSVD